MRKSLPDGAPVDDATTRSICARLGIDIDNNGRGYRKPTVRMRRQRMPEYPWPTWRRPPPVRRCVTQDATSLIYVPANSTEWTGFSSGWAAPDHLWLCQEASGNLADSIGSVTLTAAGTVTYSNAVTGWSRKSVDTADGGVNKFSSTSSSLPNLSSTSATSYMVWRAPTANPAAVRGIFQPNTIGTGGGVLSIAYDIVTPATAHLRAQTTTYNANLVGDPRSATRPLVLVANVTGAVVTAYSDYTQVSIATWEALGTGKLYSLSSSTAANSGWLYAAEWTGANAEQDVYHVKQLLVDLGWLASIAWYVTFTAALSDSIAVSDRLDVAVTDPVALAESESVTESVAAVRAAVVALAETDSESESIAVVAASVVGISESEAVTESTSAALTAKPSLTESESVAESVTVVASFVASLADALAAAESLAAVAQFNVGPSEDLDTDNEILTVVLNAVALVAEAESLAEAIAIMFQQGVLLDAALVVTESVIATFVQVIMAVASYAHAEEFERWVADCIAIENDSRCDAGPVLEAEPFDTRTWAQAMIETTSLDVRLIE